MGLAANQAWPRTSLRVAVLIVLCAILALAASPSSAQSAFKPGSVCHISVSKAVSLAEAERDPSKWTCQGAKFDWKAERHIIRHDLSQADAADGDPRYAEFDRNDFERLTIVVEGADGHKVSRSFAFADLRLGSSSLKAMVPLPDPGERVVAVTMVHEGGWFPEAFVSARLSEKPHNLPVAGRWHLLAALLCGLLLAPVIFDLVFFKALREPFPLIHALFCIMAVIQTAAVSGLLPMGVPLDYETELDITYLSLDFMIAATFVFAYFFIEAGRIPRRNRRWLLILAGLVIGNGLVTTFWMEMFGAWIDHVYFGILTALFIGYFHILHIARVQGSRVAPYLILGIAPLFAIVLIQAASVYFLPGLYFFDETWPQNFALLFEVVATAFAVSERFMIIRRERDQAVHAARDLEVLSELDELTGLRNRRALEARFAELVAQGFHAMAVVDLDHFKLINDIHGHPVGDLVIRSAAWALSPGDDQDLVAFRIGGEEFILLLRGKRTKEKAEKRRKAVTARIMAEVDALHRPVTASMGFVDFAELAEAQHVDLPTVYARADELLYAAKCSGRNCSRMDAIQPSAAIGDPGRRTAA